MQHNYEHFQQAHNTDMYKDKIYEKLQKENIREKILNGQLQRNDCDSEKVYRFLKLLKRGANTPNKDRSIEFVKVGDWVKEVKKL